MKILRTIFVASALLLIVPSVSFAATVTTFATFSTKSNGLAFDTAGNLYTAVTNYSNRTGTILKITPAGTVTTFVSLGTTSGLSSLAFDTAGNLYVASYGPTILDCTIYKITPSGVITTFYEVTQYSIPSVWGSNVMASSLAFDTAGNLYVAHTQSNINFLNNFIYKITPAGVVSNFVNLGNASISSIAFDATGNLYAADNKSPVAGTIYKVTPAGIITTFANLNVPGYSPGYLAFDTAGNLFVAISANNTIYKITPAGAVTNLMTISGYPIGLAFDAAGSLYSLNYIPMTISKVTTNMVVYSNNSSANWTITGPATITGSGTFQATLGNPSGTYTITWNTVSGYTTPASQSLTLAPGGTITFSGTYSSNPCTLPWGGAITSGTSATAYQASSVVSPATCTSQIRTCTNGTLSGTYTNQSCTVTAALAVPTVTTPTVTSITSTGATLGANVTSLGNPATITARGTCWGTTANPTTNCVAEGGTATGVFTHARTSMPVSTTYYYRGYATNSTGTGYSADGTFMTLGPIGVPTVTTPTVTSVTSTGAILGATVTSLGTVTDGSLSAKTDYTASSYPYNLTISPNGASVYVVNRNSNTVSMFSRNTTTGTLSAKTDYATGAYPNSVTISSDGTSVYTANHGPSNTVSMFSRNTTNGTLSAKTDYATGAGPADVTISPDGTSVYVVNRNSNTVSMYTRNTTNGTLSAKTDYATGAKPWGVAISSDGTSVYVANLTANTVSMYTRNTTTGTLSIKTDYATGAGPNSVAISLDGNSVYASNGTVVSMFTRSTTNGTLSAKTDYATGSGPTDVSISHDGTSLYVANYAGNTVSMFSRNTTNGTLSAKTDYATGTFPVGVVTSPDGVSVYVANGISNTISMFVRNPATITARGTCWGTTANPTTNCVAEGGTTTGPFTHARASMTENTTYYYRGYAINSTGTGYSADGTFTTSIGTPTTPTISGPTTLITGRSGTYSFVSTDPQGDQVRYGIDWNMDGTADNWLPAFPNYEPSGTSLSMSYTWPTTGSKQFQALTQDYSGNNSVWTTYTITVSDPQPCTAGVVDSVNGWAPTCSTSATCLTPPSPAQLTNQPGIQIGLCPTPEYTGNAYRSCSTATITCTLSTFCGDTTCNGSETLLTCPADCKGRYQQF